jgi:hypothetical protein
MSIQNFYTQAAGRDFARVFQFRLFSFANIDFGTDHFVYVETASLPGRQINNVQVPYMGLQFNIPGTASYPGSAGYAVTFRCDAAYDIRSAIEAATFNTFDEAVSTGQYSTPSSANTLILQLLDKNLGVARTYTLYGAYVVSLADTAYDIKDGGAIQTIQATLAYQFWRTTAAQTTKYPGTGSNIITPGSWEGAANAPQKPAK